MTIQADLIKYTGGVVPTNLLSLSYSAGEITGAGRTALIWVTITHTAVPIFTYARITVQSGLGTRDLTTVASVGGQIGATGVYIYQYLFSFNDVPIDTSSVQIQLSAAPIAASMTSIIYTGTAGLGKVETNSDLAVIGSTAQTVGFLTRDENSFLVGGLGLYGGNSGPVQGIDGTQILLENATGTDPALDVTTVQTFISTPTPETSEDSETESSVATPWVMITSELRPQTHEVLQPQVSDIYSVKLTSVSSHSISHRCGGSNRALVVWVQMYDTLASPTVTAITYGGQTMTLLGSDGGEITPPSLTYLNMFCYGLEDAPLGDNTLSMTFSSSIVEMTVLATSYFSVKEFGIFSSNLDIVSVGGTTPATLPYDISAGNSRIATVVASDRTPFNFIFTFDRLVFENSIGGTFPTIQQDYFVESMDEDGTLTIDFDIIAWWIIAGIEIKPLIQAVSAETPGEIPDVFPVSKKKAPLLAGSSYDLGLTWEFNSPIFQGAIPLFSTTQQFISTHTHIVQANGGYWSASIQLWGTDDDIEEWLSDGIMRDVVVRSPSGEVIFNGFVNKVVAGIGGFTSVVGEAMGIQNKARLVYSGVDTSVDPPAIGMRKFSDVYTNAASIAKYGVFEKIISVGGIVENEIPAIMTTHINENAYPRTSEALDINSKSPKAITLSVMGYIHLAKLYPYNNLLSGTGALSDKLALVLAAEPNGVWGTDHTIATNATLEALYERKYRDAWSLIWEMVRKGDSSGTRHILGMHKDREITYEPISDDVVYHHRIRSEVPSISIAGGGTLNPWEVTPGKYLLLTDYMTGRNPAGNPAGDPRKIFIERVTYEHPYKVSIEGGDVNRSAQLFGQYGYTGGMNSE